MLEVDGTTIAQTHAIVRFVARENNLGGKSDLEAAKADMVAETFADLYSGE